MTDAACKNNVPLFNAVALGACFGFLMSFFYCCICYIIIYACVFQNSLFNPLVWGIQGVRVYLLSFDKFYMLKVNTEHIKVVSTFKFSLVNVHLITPAPKM